MSVQIFTAEYMSINGHATVRSMCVRYAICGALLAFHGGDYNPPYQQHGAWSIYYLRYSTTALVWATSECSTGQTTT